MADKYPFYWIVRAAGRGWRSKLLCLSSSYRHPHAGAGKTPRAPCWELMREGSICHSLPPPLLQVSNPIRSLRNTLLSFRLWLALRACFTFSFLTASFTTSVPFGASTSVFPRNWKEKRNGIQMWCDGNTTKICMTLDKSKYIKKDALTQHDKQRFHKSGL